MSSYPAPSPPYLGPPAHSSGSNNKPINRIVIHSTVSPCKPGGARSIAKYFRSRGAGGSAHYVVDPAETIQAAYDSVVCWHAPPNPHSLGIEMCDMPDANSSARWLDDNHQRMLRRTARLTAQLCLAYNVPIVFLSPAGLKAGQRGITTHHHVSQAFGQSTHWDPGAWPREEFMRLVRAEAKIIKNAIAAQSGRSNKAKSKTRRAAAAQKAINAFNNAKAKKRARKAQAYIKKLFPGTKR